MTDVISVRGKLNEYSMELDQISRGLNKIERELEPLETEYQAKLEEFEIGLYARSEEEEDFKLPSEAMRIKLARKSMPDELLTRRQALMMKRDRGQERIRTLKALVEAQRSILSALKAELEAAA